MNITIDNFDYQEEALYHDAKYGSFAACRQTGKTEAGKNWIIENLLDSKDNGLWIDTKQGNIDKYVERYFRPTLKSIWSPKMYNQQKKILHFPSGSFLDFGSAESPENLEGFNYGFVVINEAGIILKNANLWYNTVMPMTKRAKVRFIGTPKGKNLFHTLFQMGLNGNDTEYKSFRISGYESPLWTKEALDKIKKSIPETTFRQEYLAEFLENDGVVFRKIKNCINNKPLLEEAEYGRTYVMSVDLAKHEDFTVIFVADELRKEIVYFERFNQIDWTLQKTKIKSVWKKFNKPHLILDSTGVGDSIYDDLKNAGLNITGFKFTNSTKKELIENLIVALENQSINFPNIDVLIDELESYEYEVTRLGNVTYNAPEGLHDDCVISLALINNLFTTKKSYRIY